MDLTLFIFFVLPLATILLAIVLQKILRSPILVAITFFAIYLILAFVFFSDTLAEALIAVIIYTIIAYITALIVMIICKCRRRFGFNENDRTLNSANQVFSNQGRCSCGNDDDNNDNGNTESNLLRISCRCGNSDESSDLLTVDSTCFANDINNNNSTQDTVSDTAGLPRTTLGTGTQYVNNATMYGNMGRGNVTRRMYRRF